MKQEKMKNLVFNMSMYMCRSLQEEEYVVMY